MDDLTRMMLKCIILAKHIDHYYHMHTPSTDGEKVSVENVQKIVSKLAGIPIEKKVITVSDVPIRAFVDRYEDRAEIYVIDDDTVPENQREAWQKYSTIKELCHIILDGEDSFEPNPNSTLQQMFEYTGPFLDAEMSPTLMSERTAEILAMEIYYPLELRRVDRDFLNAGGAIEELVLKRQVPAVIISRCVQDTYIDVCDTLWREMPSIETPDLDFD